MKPVLAFLLPFLMLINLSACSGAQTPVRETAPVTTSAVEITPETEANAAVPETEPVLEGGLFLKVSSITFSLVGESDDIYLGVIPRELLTWESDAPEIIAVDNGVLTAKGVGSATIRATYGDRQVQCSASCLAQTQDELRQLDPAILSAPNRLLPEVDLTSPCTAFDDSTILGDSITYFLWQYENTVHYLGDMTFVTRQGISLHGLVDRFKNMYYEGVETNIEDIIAKVDASRVYILLGCLDFQVPASAAQLMEHWEKLCDLIAEKAPEKEIILISNIPGYTPGMQPTQYNLDVAQITPQLRQLARERGYGFLDLGYYIQDPLGRMPKIYSKDEFHMNDAGSLVWIRLLRYSAYLEAAGGSLT